MCSSDLKPGTLHKVNLKPVNRAGDESDADFGTTFRTSLQPLKAIILTMKEGTDMLVSDYKASNGNVVVLDSNGEEAADEKAMRDGFFIIQDGVASIVKIKRTNKVVEVPSISEERIVSEKRTGKETDRKSVV